MGLDKFIITLQGKGPRRIGDTETRSISLFNPCLFEMKFQCERFDWFRKFSYTDVIIVIHALKNYIQVIVNHFKAAYIK